jgi:extracellular solute-binding protein (family 3)
VRSLATGALALAVFASACGLPRDTEGTTDRVRGGIVRAGAVIDPPWVVDSAGVPAGIEPTVVSRLAQRLGARVQWRVSTESELLHALHERELDVVVGGLADDTPWKKEIAITLPYHTDTAPRTTRVEHHVLAAAPGENRWLMELNRELEAAKQLGISRRPRQQ